MNKHYGHVYINNKCRVCNKEMTFLERYQIKINRPNIISIETLCTDCYHWYRDIEHFYLWLKEKKL